MPTDLPNFDLRPANAADLAFAWQVYRDVMKPLTEALLPWREARQKAVVAEALAEDGNALYQPGKAAASAPPSWRSLRNAPGRRDCPSPWMS